MTVEDEINRRVDILNKFSMKMGVKVEFLGTPNKFYTYLSDKEIPSGIYHKPVSTNKPLDIIRVHECSYDVLYSMNDGVLDKLAQRNTIFEFEEAEEVLHELHADIIKTLAKLNEYASVKTECDIKQMLYDGKIDLYFETLRLGESHVDFKMWS